MDEAPGSADPRIQSIPHDVVRHERARSLEEAAQLRGVPAAAVIKTMVVRKGDDDYVFVLVPGDRVIEWPKLRTHLGTRRLSMPSAQEALDVTGYVRGTITPFGASNAWPVIADTLISSGIVSIGAGAHGVSFTVDGADLCTALAAEVVNVTAPQSRD